MTEEQAVAIYESLERAGVTAWIDGGFCIDALLGEQTRDHADLDLAVPRCDARRLRDWMTRESFTSRSGGTEANFVCVRACDDAKVDVHLFAYDQAHQVSFGVAYPWGSLSGAGMLVGRRVRCVAAEWIFRFKTSYPPAPKDLDDVRRLAERFGFAVPPTHAHPRSNGL
jgi:lincosamide nucleotidyltransferase A/C/D/E